MEMSLFKKPKKFNAPRKVFNSDHDLSSEKEKDESNKSNSLINNSVKSSLLSFADEEEDEGEVFKLKKSSYSRKIHKEQKKRKDKSSNSSHAQAPDKESDINELNFSRLSISPRNSEEDSNLILSGRDALCAGRDELSDEEYTIPDAKMIEAARKKRQEARERGFIKTEEDDKDLKVGKRNVHEFDTDGSSGEEEGRVNMKGILHEEIEIISDSDSDNNEMIEWENQQMRKGAKIPSIYDIKPQKPIIKKTIEITSIKTPQEIITNIRHKLITSRELNHKHHLDINQIAEELNAIKVDMVGTSLNKLKSNRNYLFYMDFKLYLSDLIECLDEKLPHIAALEERSLSVMAKFSQNLIERRRQDVKDQAREIKRIPSQQDEEQRVKRAAEREERRSRRKTNRKMLRMDKAHNEGMSSDDEEVFDDMKKKYQNEMAQIKNEATIIFDDVVDEYCKPKLILQKFNQWRKRDIQTYKESFVHLSLPKIIGIFIRCYMILWNPFSSDNCEDIDKMKWFKSLAMYGKNEKETEKMLKNDPDVLLIPSIVEKIVLVKLKNVIDKCFDSLSTTQTLKLVKLLKQLANDYPSLRKNSKNLQSIFATLSEKMKAALSNDVFIPILPKYADSESFAFLQRQFFSGIKLFRNFASFQGVIADKMLKNLAISSLLNRYLITAMKIAAPSVGVVMAHALILVFPRVWFVTADESFIESMKMFVEYVEHLKNQLDDDDGNSMECLKQISCQLKLMSMK